MAITTIEELRLAAEQLAADLEAAGEAQAAERIRGTLAGTFPTPNEFIDQLVDGLESARRVWLKRGTGAKAMAVFKVSSAASKLLA